MAANNKGCDRLEVVLEKSVKLSSDWRAFLGELAGAGSDFLLKGPPEGVTGGFSALVKFVLSVRPNASAGFRVWSLTALAFAWALERTMIRASFEGHDIGKTLRDALGDARNLDKDGNLSVPIDFLRRPATFAVYQTLKDSMLTRLASIDATIDRLELGARIDAQFTLGVFEIWTRQPEYYALIATALGTPVSEAAADTLAWQTYRAALVSEFEVKPVFGQEQRKISLRQLYVPLRGTFKPTPKDAGASEDETDSETLVVEMSMIDGLLDAWIEQDDPEDWLRLIGGGPGSGKSTTLKAFAARTAVKERFRPLFVPLQHINLDRDLRDELNAWFVRSANSPFSNPPLTRTAIEDGPPVILIFDGLDEIVAPGEAAKDTIGTFANKLNSLYSSLTGRDNRALKVVVSGRMPAFQSAQRYLVPKLHASIETWGFTGMKTEEFGEVDEIRALDQREQWWSQYARLVGEDPTLPEAFQNKRLEGITHEPLLCYLLALSGYATSHWELAAENRNRIYLALIGSVYERGWGDGAQKRLGAGRTMTKADFFKLMETIALAAWLDGDTRIASATRFEEAITIMDSAEAWEQFTADNGDDVTNLAMNFYLKAADQAMRGFEFTHKSFGEYLAARAILSVADEVADQARRRVDHAMADWFRATRSGMFTSDTLAFIRDEARLRLSEGSSEDVSTMIRQKKIFEHIAMVADVDGFDVRNEGRTWRNLEREHASAECATWVVLNSYARAIAAEGDALLAFVDLPTGDQTFLRRLIWRLCGTPTTVIVGKCLSHINAGEQQFYFPNNAELDFSYSRLENSLFAFASLRSALFVGTNLTKARFYQFHLDNADFTDATLEEVTFHICSFKNCDFSNAVISGMTITPMSMLATSSENLGQLAPELSILLYGSSQFDGFEEEVSSKLDALHRMKIVNRNNLVPEFWFAVDREE